jgi:hypothetical protein
MHIHTNGQYNIFIDLYTTAYSHMLNNNRKKRIHRQESTMQWNSASFWNVPAIVWEKIVLQIFVKQANIRLLLDKNSAFFQNDSTCHTISSNYNNHLFNYTIKYLLCVLLFRFVFTYRIDITWLYTRKYYNI